MSESRVRFAAHGFPSRCVSQEGSVAQYVCPELGKTDNISPCAQQRRTRHHKPLLGPRAPLRYLHPSARHHLPRGLLLPTPSPFLVPSTFPPDLFLLLLLSVSGDLSSSEHVSQSIVKASRSAPWLQVMVL